MRLTVLDELLSLDECTRLIAHATGKIERSRVVGGTEINPARTSSSMNFQVGENELADEIRARLMALLGEPLEHAEPLQIARYGPGERYLPHFDWFSCINDTLEIHGQRTSTAIVYLNSVESGGATHFPNAGIDVTPAPGRVAHFVNLDPAGHGDQATLHGGGEVLAGEKWILNQWSRDRPYLRRNTT